MFGLVQLKRAPTKDLWTMGSDSDELLSTVNLGPAEIGVEQGLAFSGLAF